MTYGKQVIFSCMVAGYPEPRVNFYREGKRLRPNERITIGEHNAQRFARIFPSMQSKICPR